MADPVIATHGLSCHFGDTVAVDKLTLEVHRGEVFGFLGHNGAGKTTTVRLLNGILAPSEGVARIFGRDPIREGSEVRKRTGVLPETPALDERLTARENLRVFGAIYDVPPGEVDSRTDRLLADMELADRADERVGGFSKGMKQRLALARLLLHDPEILFLDEPTASLDPVASRLLYSRIRELTHDGRRTVFLCTHNLAEAELLCDRVAVLAHGRLLALGTPVELGHRFGDAHDVSIDIGAGQAGLATRTVGGLNGFEAAVANDVGTTITVSRVKRDSIPNLVQSLAMAGVSVYRVTPREPSLEDVYFALQDDARSQGAAP
ncbi:MAG: ABC transporter ATP-binding protein [Anaerolineae bacterium]|nr:ABC transporter ATP-binding protein [Gemmatimonadaceae bacterium]